MKASDRARLTTALRDHVAKIAGDLRVKIRAPGTVRAAAEQLHRDERVGEDFEVWTDLLSRRAAVLWVLKSVYLRVLEDRGLLHPGRLLDAEAQQLFERLAPNLGETAFLRWIYKDLASRNGGLPELFSPQPAEVALPSDDLSRALIAFWRHRDADTGTVWSFAEEHFEGELMGDLYQELDPVVKDRFALCQTPDFVRAFILDRTLTPAIETFGADEVRLLDPACGSGHFLIDGLKRIVAVTAEKHPDWDRAKVVAHALDRVVGIDLNDYACALARTRLIMTAAELAGVTKLGDAARFHPHVYWADGLEQVERDEVNPAFQYALFGKVEEKPLATLTRSDVRAALKKVFEKKFHAVVANPPYIVERDEARKKYHREKTGKKQRYVSAYRQYSLASPFTERSFQLAEKAGYIGLITSNNFMKREFGKPLVEEFLSGIDLTLVADTSQAYIPFHGTPTVLLFGRNQPPKSNTVRAVMGKRGESGTPEDPAKGKVWSSIADGWDQSGFESEYVSVTDLPRETLEEHPWSLGGGGASELKEFLDRNGISYLKDLITVIGRTNVVGHDDIWIAPEASFRRRGLRDVVVPFVIGETVRDWTIIDAPFAIYPYLEMGGATFPATHPLVTALWPWRALLERRTVFGKEMKEHGRPWWEHLEHYSDRLRTPLSIAFAFVATHNHFVLDRGGKVFKQSAPVIKLPAGASEDDHLVLLGLLNSSTACFWMKQVFHNKGGGTDSGKMQSDLAKVAHEFTATGLEDLPVPDLATNRASIVRMARAIDVLATERAWVLARVLPSIELLAATPSEELLAVISAAREREGLLLQRQIVLQEELDWSVYKAFGLVELEDENAISLPESSIEVVEVPIGARPFEILQARGGRITGVDSQSLASRLPDTVDATVAAVWEARMRVIQASPALSLIEHERYKRRWLLTPKHLAGRVETFDDRLGIRLRMLIGDLVELSARRRTSAFDIARIAADLQADARFDMLAQLITGRRDFSMDQLIRDFVDNDAVPSHPLHRYSLTGLVKHRAWERTWHDQRCEDLGEAVVPAAPPTYAQPDFVSRRLFELRGKLDVPKERFIAFTEVPGRSGAETLYGWAGWTAQHRMKAILAIDEELEDASVPLADRIGLLDSAWRLLPDVAREDAAAATRLKAELQALVGPEGPSRQLIEDWKKRFPPPNARTTSAAKGGRIGAKKSAAPDSDTETEETDEA